MPYLTDKAEDQLLLRALEDVNVPKFIKEDIPLFVNIISDLFPETERPKIDNKSLKQLMIQKEYCATTRTVLRGAWFFEFIDFIYE